MSRFRLISVLFVTIALGACQGSLVGDALSGDQTLGAQEDAYCKSIGATFGTDEYVSCRMMRSQQREDRHAVARAGLKQSLSNLGKPASSAPSPQINQRITCTTRNLSASTMSAPNYVTTCQ
jgi:hypothetical protein